MIDGVMIRILLFALVFCSCIFARDSISAPDFGSKSLAIAESFSGPLALSGTSNKKGVYPREEWMDLYAQKGEKVRLDSSLESFLQKVELGEEVGEEVDGIMSPKIYRFIYSDERGQNWLLELFGSDGYVEARRLEKFFLISEFSRDLEFLRLRSNSAVFKYRGKGLLNALGKEIREIEALRKKKQVEDQSKLERKLKKE